MFVLVLFILLFDIWYFLRLPTWNMAFYTATLLVDVELVRPIYVCFGIWSTEKSDRDACCYFNTRHSHSTRFAVNDELSNTIGLHIRGLGPWWQYPWYILMTCCMSLTGATYYPMPWHATSECTADMSPADCEFKLQASREQWNALWATKGS